MIKAKSSTGHTKGAEATCTEPQICTVCETVLELPTGHHYKEKIVKPTCTSMGYTIYTCTECGDTYISDYVDSKGHSPSDWIIDVPATIDGAGKKHIECTECGTVLSRTAINQIEFKAVM